MLRILGSGDYGESLLNMPTQDYLGGTFTVCVGRERLKS